MEKLKIEYVCFLNQSGYSQAATDLIIALYNDNKYDISVRGLHSFTSKQAFSKDRAAVIKEMIDKRRDCGVQIYHCIPSMQCKIRRLRKTFGFATFETFNPPSHWIKILNGNDGVIVPSLFNKKIFQHAGVDKPIFYVPHTVNRSLYHYNVKKHPSDVFTFMFFGTWKKRKGWQHLIEAWVNEFSKDDPVRLLIKTDKPEIAKKEIEEHKKSLGLLTKESAPILFESKIFNEFELPKFMKQADCLVSPTMGEGFGLPGLQCMALGVPVIITNFSGCQDYANAETATLLEPSGFVVLKAMDGIPQFNGLKWCYISVEAIQNAMRFAFSNVDTIRDKAKYAASYVAENFHSEVAVRAFDEIMDQI